jgi:tetratricopeptide (TPR) repeat protein
MKKKPHEVPKEALAALEKGKELFEEGKYDDAIGELNRALTIDKKLAEVYFFRGNAYCDKGDYDKAIADFTAALKIKPDDEDTKSILERVRKERENNDEKGDL